MQLLIKQVVAPAGGGNIFTAGTSKLVLLSHSLLHLNAMDKYSFQLWAQNLMQ
jgi:hypothetical protein